MTMFRVTLLAAIAIVGLTPAEAQDDDPNKWRAFVPYVRAMTDCAARAIRANPVALEMAAQGLWDDAIKTAEGCQAELSQMVSAHDRIYGWGTGAPFVRGPYKNDLPRALGERLRPDFVARHERAQQQEEARRREEQAATQAKEAGRKLLIEAKRVHDLCLKEQAVSLVPYSNESAETLVTVILAKCVDHERRREDLGVVTLGLTKEEARNVMGTIMVDTRKEWLSAIVTIRAEAQKNRFERQQRPSSPDGIPAIGGGKVY
jgi:hypothetical protein